MTRTKSDNFIFKRLIHHPIPVSFKFSGLVITDGICMKCWHLVILEPYVSENNLKDHCSIKLVKLFPENTTILSHPVGVIVCNFVAHMPSYSALWDAYKYGVWCIKTSSRVNEFSSVKRRDAEKRDPQQFSASSIDKTPHAGNICMFEPTALFRG